MTAYDASARIGEIEGATGRLLRTARAFSEPDLQKPSLCEGWDRAHVFGHVCRNADGITRLLWSARTRVPWFQYLSQPIRTAEIEASADRPLAEQLADLEASAARVRAEAWSLAPDHWERPVRWPDGREQPARALLAARLAEVEYHHVDLDAGYTFADWSGDYRSSQVEVVAKRLTPRASAVFAVVATDLPVATQVGAGHPAKTTVSGSAADLLGWLSGRCDGGGLEVEPAGALPERPSYG